MTIDPAVKAKLDAIDAATAAARTQLGAAVDASTALRTLLDATPPPPPPPPTDTAPTWASATAVRKDSTTITITYTIAGTLARIGQMGGIQGVPAGGQWQSFPKPTAATGTLDARINTTAKGEYWLQMQDVKAPASGPWIVVKVPFEASSPPPPPPPPPPGSGAFTFGQDAAQNVIVLGDGHPFIPLGVNMPGPHGYWGGPGWDPRGRAAQMRAGWGWNFIRLFEQDNGPGECQFCPSANNPWSLADVVNEYTAAGFVVMIDYHQFDFGSELTPAHTTQMLNWWPAVANQFKNNPRVWFELCNEPEATFHSYNHGAANEESARAMCYQRWLDSMAQVVQAIRATGATNMIVVNDAQAGQGCDDFWQIGPSQGSAIIARGADLLAMDRTGNLMWDVHVYDAFGWTSPEGTCSPRYTDAQRVARLADYFRRVYAATGRPAVAGEFGYRPTDLPDSGTGFHWPYDPACGSRTLLAQWALTRGAGRLVSAGGAEWSGFQLTYNGNNAYDSAGLTPGGQDWMAYCRTMGGGPTNLTMRAGALDGPKLDDTLAELLELAPPASPPETTSRLLARNLRALQLAMPTRATADPFARG